MGVVREILEWAQTLPPWQSDAVSRLFKKQNLEPADTEDLLALLKAEYGLPDPKGRTPEPLNADDIPGATDPGDHIDLLAMKNLKNVNAIAEDQNLRFSPRGLTVVYGDNGSGKSGYTRVLKKACRARDQVESILPNARSESPPDGKAEAILEINHNDSTIEEQWRDGETPPPLLSTIAIFDMRCARAYLDDEDDFQFVPYGLDILNNLATLFNQLKERLGSEQIQCEVDTTHFDEMRGPTSVGKLIEALSDKVDIKTVETLADLTPKEVARLEELSASLKEDNPKLKAEQLRRQASRLSRVSTRINEVSRLLDNSEVAKFKTIDSEYQVARKAADLAAKQFADDSDFLPGTGGPVWKSLFEAAQKFSEIAYPDTTFPNVDEGSVCPLCQQPLKEGKKHLVHFSKYIQQETEKVASEKQQILKQAERDVISLDMSLPVDGEILSEIKEFNEKLSEDTAAFAKSASLRFDQLKKAFALHNWDDLEDLPRSPSSPLEEIVSRLLSEAETLEKVANDESRRRLVFEFEELKSRDLLRSKKQAVLDAIEKMKHFAKLQRSIASLNTRSISNKANELTEKVVSKELAAALNKEFKLLMVGNLEVALQSRAHKGKALHKLKLNLPQAVKKLGDILSEGEQRAIAIASFLAEMNVSGSTGAVVFDDPVSSLDQRRRERVAKRLVEEAKTRQVIIFTHDIYFLGLLEHEAQNTGLDFHTQSLTRRPAGFGVVEPDLPFKAKRTKSRIGQLREMHQTIEKLYRDGDEPEHRIMTLNAYGFLRDTWERAIEEVLFGEVVVRYRKGVETHRLKDVIVELSDYIAVDKGMSRCSEYRHDNPALAGMSIPDPDELKADIDELEEWRKALIDRKEQNKKDRK